MSATISIPALLRTPEAAVLMCLCEHAYKWHSGPTRGFGAGVCRPVGGCKARCDEFDWDGIDA